MEKTRGYYDKNIAEIEKKGDAKITDEKQIQESRIRLMNEDNRQTLERTKAEHQAALQTDSDLFHKQKIRTNLFTANR